MAALAFRRGLVIVLFVFLLPLADPAYAFEWKDLWLTKDQQAQRQFDEGKAMEAGELFEDPVWQAVAKYRAGEFGPSAAGFATQEDIDNLYNLGNALARLGEFETAIDAYEEVLELSGRRTGRPAKFVRIRRRRTAIGRAEPVR
jgi:Ca-activated chloride channel family protein